eukprot:TRINITY_DN2534_c0_g5_i2.p1 TRINITY_DN2534_c0_g5~~TRINITY_DN2534_c0_g5_i2.p1  ORF type:complete len:638 (-),score=151.14 TRINITY_DN2534_c0_g5_i2:220-2133(-)
MGCSASRKFATSVTSTDIQAFDDKSIRSSLSSTSSDVPGPSKETFGSHGSASSSTEECQRQASRSRRLTASREEDTSLRRLGQPEETQPNLLDREGRPSGKKSRAGEREDSTDPMLSKESDRPKKKVTLNVEVDPTEFWELRSPDARDHVLSPASQKLGTSSSPSPPSSHRITLAPLDQPPVLDTVNLREPISPKLARNSFRMKRSNSGFVAVEEPLHMHRRHSGDLKTLPPKLRNLAKMDKAFGESSEDDLKAFLDRDGPSLYQDSMEADASRGLKRFALAPPPPASSAPAAAGGGGGDASGSGADRPLSRASRASMASSSLESLNTGSRPSTGLQLLPGLPESPKPKPFIKPDRFSGVRSQVRRWAQLRSAEMAAIKFMQVQKERKQMARQQMQEELHKNVKEGTLAPELCEKSLSTTWVSPMISRLAQADGDRCILRKTAAEAREVQMVVKTLPMMALPVEQTDKSKKSARKSSSLSLLGLGAKKRRSSGWGDGAMADGGSGSRSLPTLGSDSSVSSPAAATGSIFGRRGQQTADKKPERTSEVLKLDPPRSLANDVIIQRLENQRVAVFKSTFAEYLKDYDILTGELKTRIDDVSLTNDEDKYVKTMNGLVAGEPRRFNPISLLSNKKRDAKE